MKNLTALTFAVIAFGFAYAELDASQIDPAITTPFITGYTLAQSRSAELGALSRLWDGYRMNVVRGDIGESIAERAFFGGSELAHSKKGSWVSVAPRVGRQGIDHVFLRVDKNGLPNDIILGESKYGSSKFGFTKKDGQQMGSEWCMVRLRKIGDRYIDFAQSTDPIIRVKNIPFGAKSVDVYLSKTHKVSIWKDGAKYYTDAEGVSDAQLRTRANTYGRYFSDAGAGIIRTRNFAFRILEERNGDYRVNISKLTEDAQISTTRTVIVPKEFVAKGRVDMRVLSEALKRKHPSWNDQRIAQEANDIRRVVSNREFIGAASARKMALKEINQSSIVSAGIAGAFSFLFQLGAEAWEHGADVKAYDLVGVSVSTAKGAAVAGGASYLGQRTALRLAGSEVFKRQLSSRLAGRIGGGVGGTIVLAGSFGECLIGNRSWKDGTVEASIGVASMVAGQFAATGVSALLTSGMASGAAVAVAGSATAASASATGCATVAGAAGAGAASSGGLMALAAASGPAIAAIAVGAAISYGGYVVYDHYKSIEMVNGGLTFNERWVDMFFADKDRYERSVNRTFGLHEPYGCP